MTTIKIIKICSSIGSLVGLFLLFFLLSGQQVKAEETTAIVVVQPHFNDNYSYNGQLYTGTSLINSFTSATTTTVYLTRMEAVFSDGAGSDVAGTYTVTGSICADSVCSTVLATSNSTDFANYGTGFANWGAVTLDKSVELLPNVTYYYRYTLNTASYNNYIYLRGGAGYITAFGYFYSLTPPTPATMDYINYNYSQGQANITGAYPNLDPLNWSIHYNVCDTGYPPSGGNITFSLEDVDGYDLTVNGGQKLFSTGFIGAMPCQGDIVYTGKADIGGYGTSMVFLVMTTTDNENTVIQKIYSDGFTAHQSPHIIYSNGNIHYGGKNPLNINVGVATSTPISFDYNICNQENWASSTLWLYNSTTNKNTIYSFTPTVCSGIGVIDMTNEISLGFNYNAVYQIRLEDLVLETQIISNGFVINMSSQDIKEQELNRASLMSIFGKSPHDLACTNTEWSTSDNAFGINMVKMGCNIKEAFWSTADTGIRAVYTIFEVATLGLRYVFPFNLPIKISDAWDKSAITEMPSDVAFLNQADSNGDFNLDMPSSLFGASSTRVLIGKGMLPTANDPNSKLSKILLGFKGLSKYVNWGALALGIWLTGQAVLSDLNGKKEEEYI